MGSATGVVGEGDQPVGADTAGALGPLALLVGACTLGAGMVHAAAAGTHSGDAAAVWLFGAVALVQVAAGGWLLTRPVGTAARVALVSAIAVDGVAVLAWVVSRTAGLPPFTSWGSPDAIGVQDGAAALLAVLALVAVVAASFVRRPLPAVVLPLAMLVAAVPMVVGVTAQHQHGGEGGELAAHAHATGDLAAQADESADHDHAAAPEDAAAHDAAHDASHTDTTAAGGAAATDHAHDTTATSGTHDHAGTASDTAAATEEEPAHTHDTAPTSALAGDPIFAGASTAGIPDSQLAAAKDLIVNSRSALAARFASTAAAEAAGYTSIGDGRQVGGFEHFVNFGLLNDGNTLVPSLVESLVYRNDGGGQKTLVSAMYILPLGSTMASVPEIAGELTTWHDHQNLCWNGNRVVGRLVNGTCTAGVFRATPPMLHVWLVPHECGPFAGIEGHGTCTHAH